MKDHKEFRRAVGGYYKHDVNAYIDRLTADARAAEQRYQSVLSGVRQENTRLVSRLGELEARLETLENRLCAEQRRADELEHQANTLSGDLSRCRSAYEQTRQRAKRLSHSFEASVRDNQALHESLMRAEHENERLEQMRRRLAAILLEPDAACLAPMTAAPAAAEYSAGFGQGDLEEMTQNLDELGESIANRLADIDGFIHSTTKVRASRVSRPRHAEEASVEAPEVRQTVKPQPASARRVDLTGVGSNEIREAARGGFSPVMPQNDLPTNRQSHAPSSVEKRWQRLGFVVRRGRDDEEYVEENRAADPMFSSPIWTEDGPKKRQSSD